MRKLLAIDPGYATGISMWFVPNDAPIERKGFLLISGGADAFIDWLLFDDLLDEFDDVVDQNIVVVEKYVDDGRTSHDPNALEIQGFLKGFDRAQGNQADKVWDFYWQRNSMKNTKNGDKLLKQHGYWLTGKQVGWKDGRDVNDSQLHALAWAKNNHRPSQEYFFPRGN